MWGREMERSGEERDRGDGAGMGVEAQRGRNSPDSLSQCIRFSQAARRSAPLQVYLRLQASLGRPSNFSSLAAQSIPSPLWALGSPLPRLRAGELDVDHSQPLPPVHTGGHLTTLDLTRHRSVAVAVESVARFRAAPRRTRGGWPFGCPPRRRRRARGSATGCRLSVEVWCCVLQTARLQ